MKVSMIAAMAKGRVIGKDNTMPWHLPADFGWFKRNTLGKPVIMGRKTYESIGRPLPGRRNIVISRNSTWSAEGVEAVSSIDQAFALVDGVDEAVIIGGGAIYTACLPLADRLYLTFIDADIDGDTCFPGWGNGWQTNHSETYMADDKNCYNMEFVVLDR
ncbi:diacylglycerol kinase [Enterovibrio norvegicus FF-162]|uniref:Dihydrofolate reductase n=1 Tax=Enterovibrio norvegicus FF-454 TaxID=1185651 RepID=A0A1E5C4Q7_9GAMM|nr:type 3 dihydrofolate reductase [Enterovibrio norvegicus]OEE60480.1 diacylglycerol kinase [Enterovibrio norvegicus FF-454]OEE83524.1 diacylglycerol kinase [Enterovibrio norvegicus FF-162]